MQRILAASILSCLPLAACAAGASDRCDLDGLHGAEVLVRYPIPHPPTPDEPHQHSVDHIPWTFAAGPVAIPQSVVSSNDPRVSGIGDFIPGGSCDLLWEESEPERDPAPTGQPPLIRVAITEGLTPASASVFASGPTRPPLPWNVAGVLDVTGDGRADVLWWNPQTSGALIWVRTANGWTEAAVIGQLPPAEEAEPSRPATAIVRFEAGGPPGIVWQPSVNSSLYRYFRTSWNGHDLEIRDAGIVQGVFGPGYSLAAVGDFDGDGKDDLLQQSTADKNLRVCYMDGLSLRHCAPLSPPVLELQGYHHGWFVAGPR